MNDDAKENEAVPRRCFSVNNESSITDAPLLTRIASVVIASKFYLLNHRI